MKLQNIKRRWWSISSSNCEYAWKAYFWLGQPAYAFQTENGIYTWYMHRAEKWSIGPMLSHLDDVLIHLRVQKFLVKVDKCEIQEPGIATKEDGEYEFLMKVNDPGSFPKFWIALRANCQDRE